MAKLKRNINFTTLILVILLVGVAFFAGMMWMKNKNLNQGNSVSNQEAQNTPTSQPTPEALEATIGGFVLTKDEVCQENDKPSIYYFGYSGCPHCKWEHPIIQKVVKNFGDLIVFHDNMDKLDKLETQDSEILNKYQQIHGGGVPFLAFGCKYVRVGSGEQAGQKEEEKALTAILCKLTNSQPEKICASVKDLVEQVK